MFYDEDTESDSESDAGYEPNQEVSLLGRRYQDTSIQVQEERGRGGITQPRMGVRARREVIDWLVFKTEAGEKPAVSWDQIKDFDNKIHRVDLINNNVVKSDTFEDINQNVVLQRRISEDSMCAYGQLDDQPSLDILMNIVGEISTTDNIEVLANPVDELNNNSGTAIAISSSPVHNIPGVSLFSCSQECFNPESKCDHQRIVLPDFHSP